jgi:hypothetical protein
MKQGRKPTPDEIRIAFNAGKNEGKNRGKEKKEEVTQLAKTI